MTNTTQELSFEQPNMIVVFTCKENKEQGTHSGLFTIPHCEL
jgi:hypothetical protein